jgi:RND superfamily putative drug exporter
MPKRFLTIFYLPILISLPLSLSLFDKLDSDGYENKSGKFYESQLLDKKYFGNQEPDLIISLEHDTLQLADQIFQEKYNLLIEEISATGLYKDIIYKDNLPSGNLISKDGNATLILLNKENSLIENKLLINNLESLVKKYSKDGYNLYVGGALAVTYNINKIVKDDVSKAELITIPLSLILLFLFFGSIFGAITPIVIALSSIMLSFLALFVLSHFQSISIFAINIVTGLGMGLGIDYALLVVNRYKEEFNKTKDSKDAAYKTLITAGRTVIYSGFTVAVTLLSLVFFPTDFLKSLGIAGAVVVLFTVLSTIFPLIAFLVLLGPRVSKESRFKKIALKNKYNIWFKIATKVIKHPTKFFLAASTILLVFLFPIGGVEFSQADHRILPKDNAALLATEKIAQSYPNNEDIVIIIDTMKISLDEVRDEIDKLVDIQSISLISSKEGFEKYYIGTQSKAESIENIAIAGKLSESNKFYTLGPSAAIFDSKKAIFDKIPFVFIWISFFVFIIIMIFTNSILIPLKAVVMNFLSLASMLGILTFVFIDDNFRFLTGDFITTGFLDLSSIILCVVVAFGLSIDYEIFLLSRIKEEYDRSNDNDKAIVFGITNSARIITAAALILAIVFGSFVTSSVTSVKLLGFGIAAAILIDATIIRAILVPATMKLLGKYNWWAPKIIKKISIKE